MTDAILYFFSNYMIECMLGLLVSALAFRWLAYKSCKYDQVYFHTFTREMDSLLEAEKQSSDEIEDIDGYLSSLLKKVTSKLPTRSIRFLPKKDDKEKQRLKGSNASQVLSLNDYMKSEKGLIASINSESGAFKSHYPPSFSDLTAKVMENDEHWVKLFGFFRIEGVSRIIDILPGIFIVMGILGTFIGISLALPQIGNINFDNIAESGNILSAFVDSVTFAMSTSIMGIVCSIIMTFLNTLYPISDMRDEVFKSVSNTFENLWYSIHGGTTIEKQLIKVLPKMLDKMDELVSLKKVELKSTKKGA